MKVALSTAVAVVLSLAPVCALADVHIVSRLSDLHEVRTDILPATTTNAYEDHVSTTDPAVGALTAPHGAVFDSSVSATTIHAAMHGGGYRLGAAGNMDHLTTTTTFDVVFEVTQNPVQLTLHFSGGSFLYSYPQSNVLLTLVNTGTNQTLFDLLTTTPPTVFGAPPLDHQQAAWTDVTWQATLAPGTYRLHSLADYLYGDGPNAGNGSHATGTLDFTATFTPAPSSLCALLPACSIVLRRRRRP